MEPRDKLRRGLISVLKLWPLRTFLRRLFPIFLQADPPTRAICRRFALSLDDIPSGIADQAVDELWERLDPVYIGARRKLLRERQWRYGVSFVHDNVEPVFAALTESGATVQGKSFCDLGCGTHHPLGTAAIMYINGAASASATDIQDCDRRRAAEALYDLLQECLTFPDDWRRSSLPEGEFIARLREFDLKALRDGDFDAGLASTPLRHLVASIYNSSIPPGSIDIMSSRAVLEHFLDLDSACRTLWTWMSPGGLGYHFVDLVDHRAYTSTKYHWWSFLAEDDGWSDGLCNRLRASEIRASLERAGFEILACDVAARAEMPDAFSRQLKGRFAAMTDEELSTIRIVCLVKKPDA